MSSYDVVIVGAGSAGLMLARELGKMEKKTLLLDRKSNLLDFSFYTLGSFINLEEFDLTRDVVAQQVEEGILYSKRFKRIVKGDVFILDKRKVHEELLAAIDGDYVAVKLDVQIKEVCRDGSGHVKHLMDKQGDTYYGKLFVDASGTSGVLSRQVGLQQKAVTLAIGVEYNVKYLGKPNQGHLFIGKQFQGGYGWIFPLEKGRAIIGFGTFDNTVVKELKSRLNAILETPEIKKLVTKDIEKVEGGSIPLSPVLEKFVKNNLICVGDSVSQVNPVAGEGYKFIFESAVMASKAIDKALETDDLSCLGDYESAWKKRFLTSYKRGKFIQEKVFRYSKHDLLMDCAMLYLKLRSDKSIVRAISGELAGIKK